MLSTWYGRRDESIRHLMEVGLNLTWTMMPLGRHGSQAKSYSSWSICGEIKSVGLSVSHASNMPTQPEYWWEASDNPYIYSSASRYDLLTTDWAVDSAENFNASRLLWKNSLHQCTRYSLFHWMSSCGGICCIATGYHEDSNLNFLGANWDNLLDYSFPYSA